MSRIAYGTANAKELRSLAATIEHLPAIKSAFADTNTAMLRAVNNGIDLLQDVRELIDSAIVDSPPFSVREGDKVMLL